MLGYPLGKSISPNRHHDSTIHISENGHDVLIMESVSGKTEVVAGTRERLFARLADEGVQGNTFSRNESIYESYDTDKIHFQTWTMWILIFWIIPSSHHLQTCWKISWLVFTWKHFLTTNTTPSDVYKSSKCLYACIHDDGMLILNAMIGCLMSFHDGSSYNISISRRKEYYRHDWKPFWMEMWKELDSQLKPRWSKMHWIFRYQNIVADAIHYLLWALIPWHLLATTIIPYHEVLLQHVWLHHHLNVVHHLLLASFHLLNNHLINPIILQHLLHRLCRPYTTCPKMIPLPFFFLPIPNTLHDIWRWPTFTFSSALQDTITWMGCGEDNKTMSKLMMVAVTLI